MSENQEPSAAPPPKKDSTDTFISNIFLAALLAITIFVIAATIMDLVEDAKLRIFAEGSDEGYTQGLEKGRSEGFDEGYAQGHEEGYTEGFNVFDQGTPIHDCDMNPDGSQLTFFIGQQKLRVHFPDPIARPFELYHCTNFSSHGDTITIYREYGDSDFYYLTNQPYTLIEPVDE